MDYDKWQIEQLADDDEALGFLSEAVQDFAETGDGDVFKIALDYIIEAQGKDSRLASTVYLARAAINFCLKRYEDSIADFKAVLEIDMSQETAFFGQIMAYSHMPKHQTQNFLFHEWLAHCRKEVVAGKGSKRHSQS